MTTAQAAALCGMAPSTFRKAMTRARAKGVDLRRPADQWPDQRTPTWDPARLREWLAAR